MQPGKSIAPPEKYPEAANHRVPPPAFGGRKLKSCLNYLGWCLTWIKHTYMFSLSAQQRSIEETFGSEIGLSFEIWEQRTFLGGIGLGFYFLLVVVVFCSYRKFRPKYQIGDLYIWGCHFQLQELSRNLSIPTEIRWPYLPKGGKHTVTNL